MLYITPLQLWAHAVGPLGGEPLDWSTSQISGVVAGGSPVHYPSRVIDIDGEKCLTGNLFNINVRDDYGFNIDEPDRKYWESQRKPWKLACNRRSRFTSNYLRKRPNS